MLSSIWKSLRDGTFGLKVLNRLSHKKYVPSPDLAIDQYISENYPGDGWKSLPMNARKIWLQFSPVFNNHEIHSLAYVGANVGRTALSLDAAFPGLEFYLIEPVPQVFQTLVRNTAYHHNMHCINVAAGSKEGWECMHVDDYSPASSLLPYECISLQEFPFLGKQGTVNIQVRPLDDILRDCRVRGVDLVLMDVQGYEDEVLKGAALTLKSCKVVVSELSLQRLYVGSSTFDSIYQKLFREDFQLRYLLNPLEGVNHRILQIDGVFVREREDVK